MADSCFSKCAAVASPIGPAIVTSFVGDFGGSAITALLPPGSFGNNDNELHALSPSNDELTVAGISFIAGGIAYNLFGAPVGFNFDRVITPGPVVSELVGDGQFSVSAAPAETPIPAALPLFATGLGALGLIAYRKRQKQSA